MPQGTPVLGFPCGSFPLTDSMRLWAERSTTSWNSRRCSPRTAMSLSRLPWPNRRTLRARTKGIFRHLCQSNHPPSSGARQRRLKGLTTAPAPLRSRGLWPISGPTLPIFTRCITFRSLLRAPCAYAVFRPWQPSTTTCGYARWQHYFGRMHRARSAGLIATIAPLSTGAARDRSETAQLPRSMHG